MLIKGIDLPDALIRAREAGELVVFAGAGVSMPPPSSLPSFPGLVTQIGSQTPYNRQPDETEDRYLGRLKAEGVHVHDAASKILLDPASKPHPLHSLLLRLFQSPENVRLVTTNFDVHFSNSAAQLFQPSDQPEIFFAPALPLGDDFKGLVYLHGCAAKDPITCVLTDEDFGRAYLTQAWASRFLAAMFSRYSVLFVGYSHNDTVMNYLARGLPPVAQKPRFAFTEDSESSLTKWRFLGIHSVKYTKCGVENPHQAITDCVGEWVVESQRGLLERAQRIRLLAQSQPPLEGEDADYLRYSLSRTETAREFLKFARAPEWVSWLEKNGLIQGIFKPSHEFSEFERQLSLWLAEHFAVEQHEYVMASFRRNGSQISRQFCWDVWRKLVRSQWTPKLEECFGRWTTILLAQPSKLNLNELIMLLEKCRFPNEYAISVLLFDAATTPQLLLRENWSASFEGETNEAQVYGELTLSAHTEGTSEVWRKQFLPNLAEYAASLEPIISRNLASSHHLLEIFNGSSEGNDPLRAQRQSVASSERDDFRRLFDDLVDSARDLLLYLLVNIPAQGAALIDKWSHSRCAILRRLAVFGFAKRTDMTSDEKLHWLLEQKLLYKFKTDVFFFLKETFNAAGEATQKRIVDTAKEGLVGPEFSQYDPRTLEYEKYNLFIWLNRIAPDCSCVSQELESIRTENPTFRPRENPDLDFWTSGGDREVPDEGFEIASTLANDPKEFLDKFDAWQPRSPIDRSRADNCASLSAAITKDAQWGLSFVKMLVSLGRSDGDLWSAVCQGWRNAELSNQLWGQILTFTLTAPAPNEFYEAFVDVLEHGTRRETFALPEAEMDQAEAIAIRIWNSVLRQTPVEDNTMKDWLAMAINRPGGKLAEFWLQRLSSARKEAGDSWAGFRHSMSEALTEIIAGTSGPAAHARVVFASQFHYLHALDPAFATQTILPLFDWKIDVVRAEQSWHGFLYWGRWPKALHTQLLPLFDETINRAGQFPKELRERIADWIALVAIFVIDDPLAWIMSAVGTINEEMRDQLASAIHQQLEAADPTQGERLWDRWLRKYWETRLLNIPKPLTQEEMSQMLCWALYVGSRFNQATQLAMAFGERASFKGDSFLYRLNKSGRPKSDPQPTADLLLYYLKHTTDLFAGHVTEIWTSLAASGLAASQIQAIREEMFRLGHDPVAT